ncbi:TonB-dependent receptor plug domain-containing protein [Sphingobium sp. H39-3-25]|uniref:TonB-dependent receptor n=1 Tax=Sphingobium arseniciresistens TaxID=3030834 RepID=UPI0023B97660|nr:TonB-dependent receptor plug domain-containing protein [Sphingobium arseniciresistens]
MNENLQRVPVAITALDEEKMISGGVYDQHSLFSQVAGLQNYTKAPGNAAIVNGAKVRGVQGIAYYFNGIPYPSVQWSYFAPFFDVQSVQVLKGPQGTLFGQASNSGAIIAEPNKPKNEFGGYISGSIGNYGLKTVEGAIDLPLIKDHVLLRVSGRTYYRGGFIKDIISGYRLGQDNYDILRGILVLKANESLQNETLIQFERAKNSAWAARTLNALNMSPQFPRLAAQAALNGMTVAQYRAARDQILAQQIALGPYKIQGWSTGCPGTAFSPPTNSTVPGPNVNNVIPQPCSPGEGGRAENNILTNTTTWSFTDQLTAKNIFGYSWGRSRFSVADQDFTRLILQDTNPRSFQYEKYAPTRSDELQLIGDFGALDFVAGLFWYNTKLNPTTATYAQFVNNLVTSATKTAIDNTSKAIYAQGNYDASALLPGLTLTAGLRYTKDRQIRTNYVLNPTTLAVTSVTGGRGVDGGDGRWDATTYTLSAQYQVTPQAMIYFTNSKGYSTGGLQNIPGFFTYDPDSLNNLEAGLKATWRLGEWNVRTNLAAYYGYFNNVKVTQSFVYTIPGTNSQAVTNNAIQNAAKARIKGLEFEGTVTNGRFELSGFAAYSKAYFTDYPSLHPVTLAPIDRSADPFSNAPKWKVGLSPSYRLPLESLKIGDVRLFANFSFNSSYYTNFSKPIVPINNDPDTAAICRQRRTAANGYGPLSADGKWAYLDCARAWHNLNVGISWTNVLDKENLDATLLVTNATFYKGMLGINSIYDGGGYNTADTNLPRFVSLTIRYGF